MNGQINKTSQPQIQSVTWNNLTWTDISYPSRREVDSLGAQYHFHPLSLEDSLSRSQLSKIDDHGTYLLLILHFPVSDPDEQVLKTTWLCAFIGHDYIITLHDGFRAISDLFADCQNNPETKRDYFMYGPGYLTYRILDGLFKFCLSILDKLMSRMDSIEDQVFDENSNDTQSIAILRRDLITLRRIIWPSRTVIGELQQKIKVFAKTHLDIYFDDLLDKVNRIWENLEESKEVIEVFKDSDFVLVTNRINRIVQSLAIISAILLPFIVVSSIYGMNINLPGGIERGSLESFGILIFVMILISSSMLYYFHRRRWI